MDKNQFNPLALMAWPEFQEQLEASRREHTSSDFPAALETYLGIEDRHRLEALADRSIALRMKQAPLGNVVVVHGLMCSNLTTAATNGLPEPLWMNMTRLAGGDLKLLRLDREGARDADPDVQVTVDGIIKFTYALTLASLHARWNVLPFAFDWRKDLDVAADGLAEFIQSRFNGQPVHLVGHSMGGLVCRNLIRRHPRLWQAMRDRELRRGGRLIQLGTPNYGTFLATQMLSGQSELLWALDSADPHHGLADLLDVMSSFVSLYQLLPSPDRLSIANRAIFLRETWGAMPGSAAHLERAAELHAMLRDPATRDPERLIYVAGYGHRTPSGLQIRGPGLLDHSFSFQGDGITTLAHGPIAGVPTWYIMANHLELASQPRVLSALDDLLYRGRTLILSGKPLPVWLFQAPIARAARSLGRVWLNFDIREVAWRIGLGTADASEVHRAERVLIETAQGERRVTKRLWELERNRLPERLIARTFAI